MAPAPQLLTTPSLHSLYYWAALLVIVELLLAAGVAATSYGFAHYHRGTYLNPRAPLWGIFLSFSLLVSIVANWVLIALRLSVAPHDVGSTNELVVTGVAMAVLWRTDIIVFRLSVRCPCR